MSTTTTGQAMVEAMVTSTMDLIAYTFPLTQWILGLFVGLLAFGLIWRYSVGKRGIPRLFR